MRVDPDKLKEMLKCEICKERDFTIIFDGVKTCITCYDIAYARAKEGLPSIPESDKLEQK